MWVLLFALEQSCSKVIVCKTERKGSDKKADPFFKRMNKNSAINRKSKSNTKWLLQCNHILIQIHLQSWWRWSRHCINPEMTLLCCNTKWDWTSIHQTQLSPPYWTTIIYNLFWYFCNILWWLLESRVIGKCKWTRHSVG